MKAEQLECAEPEIAQSDFYQTMLAELGDDSGLEDDFVPPLPPGAVFCKPEQST